MTATELSLLLGLADTLEQGFREAVAQAQRKHAGEQIYAFILYTTPLFESATLSFHSEEALSDISKDEQQREQLRWQPPEWKYNWEGQELFEPANEILVQLATLQGDEEHAW